MLGGVPTGTMGLRLRMNKEGRLRVDGVRPPAWLKGVWDTIEVSHLGRLFISQSRSGASDTLVHVEISCGPS